MIKIAEELELPTDAITQTFAQIGRKGSGSKTKELWKNEDYRNHMSKVHKGQKAWNKGIPFKDIVSDEIRKERKKKISIGLKLAYREGKRKYKKREKTKEELLKQSISLKRAYLEGRRDKGKKHPNWKGGITSNRKKIFKSLDYKLWRLAVFERDNFTCKKCKKIGGMLEADHIKRWSKFPQLVFDINNGQTLCIKCHRHKTAKENSKC